MIVRMKKVTLLAMENAADATLHALRDLGVLHLTPVRPPQGPGVETIRARLADAQAALARIEASTPDAAHPDVAPILAKSAEESIARIGALSAELTEASERETEWIEALEAARPFGDFDPRLVASLTAAGVPLRVYRLPRHVTVAAPEGASLFRLGEDGSFVLTALVGAGELPPPAVLLPLPEHPLSQCEAELNGLRQRMDAIRNELKTLTVARPAIEAHVKRMEDDLRLAMAQAGMGADRHIIYLQGYCPVDHVSRLEQAAVAEGWGHVIEDPKPEDDVPTLVVYPRWIKPIKAIFEMLGVLPGYRESDISVVFFIFFSLFFAMLVGDAGYGVLILALTLGLRRKFRRAPAYPFTLFTLLSLSTIAWGLLTGNIFGIRPESLPGFLQRLQVPWLMDPEHGQDNLMRLCFLIGAIHISIAHLWNAVVLFPDWRAAAQVGWLALAWTMYFLACFLVLGTPPPSFLPAMLIGGLVCIVLFMTPPRDFKKEWINHAMLPLSIASVLVDVISYIRLFAVGMASLAVAQSFNDMVLGLGIHRIWTIPIIVIVLALGHGLNIMLAALGILVHAVRLNTLEFSQHKGMQWSGVPYTPFSKHNAN